MPNYKYLCNICGGTWTAAMKLDSDPTEKIKCNFRMCNGKGERRIIGDTNISVKKETLGGWYKKETGKELLGE
jgi:predicted nucleic acid-binding Zn ribbon protein